MFEEWTSAVDGIADDTMACRAVGAPALQRHRGALLDLAAWAQVEVVGDEADGVIVARVLAAETASLEGLSLRGLRLLAALSGLRRVAHDSRGTLMRRLRRSRGWRAKLRLHRRRIMGSILSRLLHDRSSAPESTTGRRASRDRIKQRIQDAGVVGGITGELRSAADGYVARKLDEIEQRVDSKLDEIDRRLREWRDREIASRLKILKFTLVVTILVALISLGYDYCRPGATPTPESSIRSVADGSG